MPTTGPSTTSRSESPVRSGSGVIDAPRIKNETTSNGASNNSSSTRVAFNAAPKYVPLLPKAVPEPVMRSAVSAKKSSQLPVRPRRQCRVKICKLEPCTLLSHRHYRFPRKRRETSRTEEDARKSKNEASSSSNETALYNQLRTQLSIIRGGVDGLPVLPLDGLKSPVFQELFRTFFNYQCDRIIRIMYPPPLRQNERSGMHSIKRDALSNALSAPVFCLNYIATAHFNILAFKTRQDSDQNAVLLYGQIMKLLRAKLDNYNRRETTDLVMVIFTLASLEVATGRVKSLVSHRKAVHHLIKLCGGIHVMPRTSIPLILALDRFLSIFTCQPPQYTAPPHQLVRRPPTVPVLYGQFLDEDPSRSLLGEGVHQFCVDCCRLIEIIEWEGISFDPNDSRIQDSPNIYYFFFLRECEQNNFISLHVKLATEQSIRRCVLMTVKIVEFVVAMDMYQVMIPVEMSDKIREILIDRDSGIEWQGHESLLMWILFILASLPCPWVHRDWALTYLRKQLRSKYGGQTWPVDWRQIELGNLRHFVWSDTRFFTKFAEACNDLQRLT